jgi:hypothetical protein
LRLVPDTFHGHPLSPPFVFITFWGYPFIFAFALNFPLFRALGPGHTTSPPQAPVPSPEHLAETRHLIPHTFFTLSFVFTNFWGYPFIFAVALNFPASRP